MIQILAIPSSLFLSVAFLCNKFPGVQLTFLGSDYRVWCAHGARQFFKLTTFLELLMIHKYMRSVLSEINILVTDMPIK